MSKLRLATPLLWLALAALAGAFVSIHAIVPALWAGMFLFPLVLSGPRAISNAFRIVRPVGPLNPGGSTTRHAHVQELGEYRVYKLLAVAITTPFYFLTTDPFYLAVALHLFAFLIVDQLVRKIEGTDYAGHGAEIMSAEAEGDETYRSAEIARLLKDHDKKGEDVVAGLARWNWLARITYVLGRW